jgi:hypothetical protein
MRTMIVGLGNAAWMHGIRSLNLNQTHTFALVSSKYYEVIAGVDSNLEKRLKWSNYFGIPTFDSIDHLSLKSKIDLIVICVNSEELARVLKVALIKFPESKIIVEKPLAINSKHIDFLNTLINENLDRIVINLPRLYFPEVHLIKQILVKRQINSPESINGYYSHGYLNTATHLYSLINFWFPYLEIVNDNVQQISNYDYGVNIKLYDKKNASKYIGNLSYENSQISTFDLRIKTHNFEIDYLDGGENVTIKDNGKSLNLISSRKDYQKCIYSFIEDLGWNKALKISGCAIYLPQIKSMIEGLPDWRADGK